MSNNFTRTLRALQSDGWSAWAVRAGVGALLLGLWGLWFFGGRVTVWAVSESARAEVSEEIFKVEAPVDGQVVAVHIERGQEVRKGDPLVELESFQQEGERDTLVAKLETSRIRELELTQQINRQRTARDLWVSGHETRVAEALSNLRKAESEAAQARRQEGRMRKLFDDELASRGDLDEAVTALESAEAEVESLRAAVDRIEDERVLRVAERDAEIEELKGDLRVLQASILSEETSIETLAGEVEQRMIRAPASGTLARIETVREGAVVEQGDELARIVPSGGRIGALGLFSPADAVGRIQPGQQARMRLDGFPSTQFGTVPATVAVVDSETTDGRIRVDFDIADDRPSAIDLQHGMVGSIEVEVGRLSPASLLMRAVGKLLDQPTATGTESLAEAD